MMGTMNWADVYGSASLPDHYHDTIVSQGRTRPGLVDGTLIERQPCYRKGCR